MAYTHGPLRPHGKILGMDEEPGRKWSARFNRKLSIGAAAMLAAIWIFVGISSL